MCIYCKLVIFLTWTFFIIDERHVFVIYLINKYEAKYIFYFKCHSKRATMFSQRYQYKHLPLFCYYQTEKIHKLLQPETYLCLCCNIKILYRIWAFITAVYAYLSVLYMCFNLFAILLSWVLFFLSLICIHAFVVFKCYLFLCCICRLKSHSNLCCICCFNITT